MNTKKTFSERQIEGILDRLEDLKQDLKQQGRTGGGKVLDNFDFIKLFNISVRTSLYWRRSGKIRYSRVGRKIYFKLSDIEKMLDAHLETI